MDLKYEITTERRNLQNGTVVYRIKSLKDFNNLAAPFKTVSAGEIGGWVSGPDNLSQHGSCWVADNAVVCDAASISQHALISGNALVQHAARVFNAVLIRDDVRVGGRAIVGGNSLIQHDVVIDGDTQILQSVTICRPAPRQSSWWWPFKSLELPIRN